MNIFIEKERKFLVDKNIINDFSHIEAIERFWITQGYINDNTRVRETIDINDVHQYFLTLKFPSESMDTREEFEIQIEKSMGRALLDKHCKFVLRKHRWIIKCAAHHHLCNYGVSIDYFPRLDIDVLEVETTKDEDTWDKLDNWLAKSEHIIKEVTEDPQYLNCNLAKTIKA